MSHVSFKFKQNKNKGRTSEKKEMMRNKRIEAEKTELTLFVIRSGDRPLFSDGALNNLVVTVDEEDADAPKLFT